MVRVRFAPSPTGIIHIGGIRTALYNFLLARHTKGEFILRIEDTDRKRLVENAEEVILESLDWLGLKHDGEITHQSERLDIYAKHLEILKAKDLVYKKDGAFYFKMPKEGETKWNDEIRNKEIVFANNTQEDFVVIKSDLYPTYNFANVIDDYLMGITHVIRGKEFISSTPKHIHLYEAFGWEIPKFVHMPVLLGEEGKLSKRKGAKSMLEYRDEGYLKEAILNFIALLGWTPKGDKEILTLEEMVDSFDLKDINDVNSKLDEQKLSWLNGMWIRKLAAENKLEQILQEKYQKNKEVSWVFDSLHKDLIIGVAATRMKTLNDFEGLISGIDKRPEFSSEDKKIAFKLITFLESEKWEEEEFIEVLRRFNKETKVDFKKIYYLLTGKEHGLPLPELLKINGGKTEFIKTFKTILDK
jgi:glutamyl/glutaminyl-tRNA synthetase